MLIFQIYYGKCVLYSPESKLNEFYQQGNMPTSVRELNWFVSALDRATDIQKVTTIFKTKSKGGCGLLLTD